MVSHKNVFELRSIAWIALLVFVLLIAVACGPSAPTVLEEGNTPTEGTQEQVEAQPEQGNNESGYPAPPVVAPIEEAYPAGEPIQPEPTPTPETYPPVVVQEVFAEPRFSFDGPLSQGATAVAGQAPPGLTLAIIDVTFNGVVLGSGVSDGDGRYNIGVQPLPEGHRIGLTFAELEAGLTSPQMAEKYFPHRGDGFMNLPNVGIFFETAMVE